MKRNTRLAIFLVITLAVLVGTGFIGNTLFHSSVVYQGKNLFTSAQYEDFKLALSDRNITIDEIIILSSSPILVDFRIRVPRNYDFSYGQTRAVDGEPWNVVVSYVLPYIAACLTLLLIGAFLLPELGVLKED